MRAPLVDTQAAAKYTVGVMKLVHRSRRFGSKVVGDVMQAVATTTAQRLSTLAQLYQQGQTSQLMDRTLDKLLAHEAEQARLQLETLDADLATFEQQYDMTSAEFFGDYQAGQTDDRMDYVEWASLVRMKENLLCR